MRRLLGILLTPIRLSRVGFVGRWLRLRAYSPSAFDGIATLLLSGPVYVIFRLFGVQPWGPEEEIALAATSAFVAFVLVSAIDFMLVGSLVRRVHSLAAAARGPARKTVLEFIDRHLRKLDQELKAMLSEEGAVLDVEDAAFWIEQSFLSGKGTTYNGTDSHLPSEYFELYPNYLEAHKTMLPPINAESASVDRGSRILIGAPDRFREDYFAHKDTSYSEFLGWHTEQRVALLQCDVDDAQRLKRDALDAIRRYATEPDGVSANRVQRVTFEALRIVYVALQ